MRARERGAYQRAHGNPEDEWLTLDGAARQWPTPTAGESERTSETMMGGNATLNGATREWQTPGTDSFRSRGGDRKDEMGLDQQARYWVTPQAASGGANSQREGREGREGTGGPDLMEQVAHWPTPRSEDSESAGNHPGAADSLTGVTSSWATPAASDERMRVYSPEAAVRQDGKSRMDILEMQAVYSPISRPGPATGTPGDESSGDGRGSRRQLNPMFVEWLMGWPVGWTSLAPLGSALPGMEWSRGRRSEPWDTSGDNWPTPDTQNARGGARRAEAKGKHAVSLHHAVDGWEVE